MIIQVKNNKGLHLGSDRGEITDAKAEFITAKDCLHLGGVLMETPRQEARIIQGGRR